MDDIISDAQIKVEPICPEPGDHKITKRLKERYQYLSNLSFRTVKEFEEIKFLQLILEEPQI